MLVNHQNMEFGPYISGKYINVLLCPKPGFSFDADTYELPEGGNQAVFDDGGALEGILSVGTDITATKVAEKKFLQQHAELVKKYLNRHCSWPARWHQYNFYGQEPSQSASRPY